MRAAYSAFINPIIFAIFAGCKFLKSMATVVSGSHLRFLLQYFSRRRRFELIVKLRQLLYARGLPGLHRAIFDESQLLLQLEEAILLGADLGFLDCKAV